MLGRETSKLVWLPPCWEVLPQRALKLLLTVLVVLILLLLPCLVLLPVRMTLLACSSPVFAQPSRRLFCLRDRLLVLLVRLARLALLPALLVWILPVSLPP